MCDHVFEGKLSLEKLTKKETDLASRTILYCLLQLCKNHFVHFLNLEIKQLILFIGISKDSIRSKYYF